MKPVFVINGFLESGKTEFITYTLQQPYFQTKGKTLLLLCEEGEIEYDENVLKRSKTIVEVIDEEEDFTPSRLIELEKKHSPERIIIEYNGMWNYKNMKLPWHWKVEQQITTIDATTFPAYFANMRSLLAEMVRKSEMIIFNRCDGIKELSSFKRSIMAINQQAEIIFEDSQGEINEMLEEELPYDVSKDVIELTDETYGIWYIDVMDHVERYLNKTITFTAMVLKPDHFPKGHFVPGRMVMTCCADDIAFLGYVCKYDGAEEFAQKDWVRVTATVHNEFWVDYNREGPFLHGIKVEKTKAPKEEVIAFA